MLQTRPPLGRGAGRGPRTTARLIAAGLALSALAALAGCSGGTDGGEEAAPAPRAAVEGLPAIDLARLEPALAKRLTERLDAVRERPDSGAAWGRLGVALDVHAQYAEAITCYERAETLEPQEFLWPYLLGNAKRLGDSEAALAHFRRAAELREAYAPVHHHVGDLELMAGDLEAAEASFRRAIEVDDTLVAAHLGLGKIALEGGDAETARVELEKAAELGARSGEVHFLLAETLRRLGDEEAAELQARQAGVDWLPEPVADPARESLWWSEGVTTEWRRRRSRQYAARGNFDAFRAEWQQAMEEAPDAAEPHMELAEGYVFVGRLDEARESYHAIELEPDNASAHLGLGNVLARMGRREDAVAMFERALALDPSLFEARSNLGGLLIQLGRTEEGLAHLEQACVDLPNNADAQVNLGIALRGLGRAPESGRAFQRALAIDPNHLRARFERALLLAQTGMLEAAAAEFEVVTVERPQMGSAWSNLGQARQRLGETTEAIRIYREGLENAPDTPALLSQLSWLLSTSPDETLRDGLAAVKLGQRLNKASEYGNPFHLDVLAAACAEKGDFPVAVRYQSKAVDIMLHPAGPGVEGRWGRVIDAMQQRLALYEQNRPYHTDPAAPGPPGAEAEPNAETGTANPDAASAGDS